MHRFYALTRGPVVALAAAALLSACGPGKNDNSGGDEKRESAVAAALSVPVHDRLDPTGGDSTDWKHFDVPVYETTLTLFAWWDDPNVLATITMRDQFGGKMYSLKHEIGKRKESWGNIRVRQGRYYLQVEGSGANSSVYTLELRLTEGGPDALPESFPDPT